MIDENQELSRAQSFRLIARDGLPLFLREKREYDVFYAPGLLHVAAKNVSGRIMDALRGLRPSAFDGGLRQPAYCPGGSASAGAASALLKQAEQALRAGDGQAREPFRPECLTLFLNNACNLRCRYCHAAPESAAGRPLTKRVIADAAQLCAMSCAARNQMFTIAFHGGGEPVLAADQVDGILELARYEARRAGVGLRSYIATNGVMPMDLAEWVARQFDLIGLSCDGPPEIQDRQRPMVNAEPTFAAVARTAAVFERAGRPYQLRTTITRETIDRQAEIVAYFAEHFAPQLIRLEPVYNHPGESCALGGTESERFVTGFMKARERGASSGIPVVTSLTRPNEFFGRYCNVLRGVVNLAPGDVATGCFLESRADGIDRRRVRTGGAHPTTGVFALDAVAIERMKTVAGSVPEGCRTCLCAFQCTYGCPDICIFKDGDSSRIRSQLNGGFRCRANRALLEARLLDTAETAWRRGGRAESPTATFPEDTTCVAVHRA